MAIGISLHIAATELVPAYGGTMGDPVWEQDAYVMRDIAVKNGFEARPLLVGAGATYKAVLAAIAAEEHNIRAGNVFLITYTGHGSWLPRLTPGPIDPDETWCLNDLQLRDKELLTSLSCFEAGSRVVVISDSCYSGGLSAIMALGLQERLTFRQKTIRDPLGAYLANRSFYDRSSKFVPAIKANVIYLAACGREEPAQSGAGGSVFTNAIQTVYERWQTGEIAGPRTYADLIAQAERLIVDESIFTMHPSWASAGATDLHLEQQMAFSI